MQQGNDLFVRHAEATNAFADFPNPNEEHKGHKERTNAVGVFFVLFVLLVVN